MYQRSQNWKRCHQSMPGRRRFGRKGPSSEKDRSTHKRKLYHDCVSYRLDSDLDRSRSMPQIAIVGAGIAGLNAALTLQDAGLSCNIYEASERIGGRMHSDTTTWADGMVSEWCGEFIDSDHKTIHQLIKRFGLETISLGQRRA